MDPDSPCAHRVVVDLAAMQVSLRSGLGFFCCFGLKLFDVVGADRLADVKGRCAPWLLVQSEP